jgi:pimeloyl-ACP methyl ester carboxylesterase
VAQVAACLGREFSHEMLLAVSPLGTDALETALERLAASGLIRRQGAAPAALYAFTHALVQEAAYQSLLRTRRRELHACIARAVEDRFPDVAARQPEWVAHHCTEAGLAGPASAYWLEAARRAKATYALREAAGHLATCLEVLQTVDDGPRAADFRARRIEALVLLGDVASLTGELEGSNRHYERALELTSDPETGTRIGNKRHQVREAIRDGARIAFYGHGGGPDTLLLVSPLAYGLATIQPLLERLCQEFRIVTVDPRGAGASDLLTRPYALDEHLKDVRAVIAALGDRAVVAIGISSSGMLLLKLARAEPRLFAKLVTVGCPPGDFSRPFFSLDYMDELQAALESQDVAHLVRSHVERVFSEPEMRELREQTIRSRLLLPRETILSFFDPDPGKNIMPLLADIQVPVLVTHGREDRLVAFTAAEQIAAVLPNARLYAFEGRGHLPIFTATDEFCEVLRRFVRAGTAAFESRP